MGFLGFMIILYITLYVSVTSKPLKLIWINFLWVTISTLQLIIGMVVKMLNEPSFFMRHCSFCYRRSLTFKAYLLWILSCATSAITLLTLAWWFHTPFKHISCGSYHVSLSSPFIDLHSVSPVDPIMSDFRHHFTLITMMIPHTL